VLSLDDPRWRDLAHRNWIGGLPAGDPDAPIVPDILARLYETPEDAELFSGLWPYLCSEGTTYAAAYAAIPHIVKVAASLAPERRTEQLIFVGVALIYATPEAGDSYAIKEYVRASFDEAKRDALSLMPGTLEAAEDEVTARYLLAATAALLGYPRLGEAVENLDLDRD
jgi:hypothetical protein